MKWFRRKHFDREIAPDEIFLDASNAPAFDRGRFEGRLERPLSQKTFYYLAGVLASLFFILIFRAWDIQIVSGAEYAEQSAKNSLIARPLIAPRGIITDVNGVVVAENVVLPDGSVSRHYPVPSMSHLLGYVSTPKKDASGVYYDTNITGLAGLEAEYDSLLAGENGQLLTETDVFGRVRSEGIVVPAKEGSSITLSIDSHLQTLLEDAIRSTAIRAGFIAGSGVVMDTTSGAVRAIVSYPSYDSNVMSRGWPASAIANYNKSPGFPFLDHAVQGVYAPGSVVKPLIAVGVLTDGIVTPETIIDDPGSISIPDPYNPGKRFIYKGWKVLGPMDIRTAIAWSSDIYFYTVGGGFKNQRGLGIERLEYWYRQFGLGSPTGIDMPGEASGLIPNPAWKQKVFEEPWYLGDTYFTSIGQYSMQVTPIQMARATAAVANGGKLFTPTLFAGQAPVYKIIEAKDPAFAVARSGMRLAVTDALASRLNVPFITVAAKTGTAQTGTRNQYDNSWVVGFFPYENPQYAFALVLERGPEGAGAQSVNAMRDFLDALHEEDSIYLSGKKEPIGKNE